MRSRSLALHALHLPLTPSDGKVGIPSAVGVAALSAMMAPARTGLRKPRAAGSEIHQKRSGAAKPSDSSTAGAAIATPHSRRVLSVLRRKAGRPASSRLGAASLPTMGAGFIRSSREWPFAVVRRNPAHLVAMVAKSLVGTLDRRAIGRCDPVRRAAAGNGRDAGD